MASECETIYANSVFEQPWWLDIVAEGHWKEVFAYNEDKSRVIGRLPYVIKNGVISRPVYTQTLGMWVEPSLRIKQRGNEHWSSQKNIYQNLIEQIPTCRSIDFVFDSSVEYILPFRWLGYRIEPTFSYRINNIHNIDDVRMNYSKGVKRDINRGNKKMILDDSDKSINDFIELQNLTYKRQGRSSPTDNSITYDVINKTLHKGHGKLLIARDENGIAHSGSFLVFDKRVCYLIMSGQNTEFGNDGAMPFILDRSICFASKVSEAFDFEGSMIEGIEQVYRRYGGIQVINWHVCKQGVLGDIKDVLKPRIKRIIGYRI